jgi:hypothetical protein
LKTRNIQSNRAGGGGKNPLTPVSCFGIRPHPRAFTPCPGVERLLEAHAVAAQNAVPGDVILLSPACSSFDQFRNLPHRGEWLCVVMKSTSRGVLDGHHYMSNKKPAAGRKSGGHTGKTIRLPSGFFEETCGVMKHQTSN